MINEESDKSQAVVACRSLLREERWSALAVIDRNGLPALSQVAYACNREFTGLYLHLSSLAAHSRSLNDNRACALAISRPDHGSGDPQQLARVTLQGHASPLSPSDPNYHTAKTCYLDRLPDAEPRFAFGDFALYQFTPQRIRYVEGFGRAFSFIAEQLQIIDDSP